MPSKLVVLSGLPGTGKSEVAEAIGARLRAPVFSKDWVEAPLLQSGLVPREQLGALGYDLLTALANRQLMLRQSVVLDSVASTESIRSRWRDLARTHSAGWYVIECVCSDSDTHRSRMDGRRRGIPGWPELTWGEVERVRGYFVPWTESRLTLDAVHPLTDNVMRALEYVGEQAV